MDRELVFQKLKVRGLFLWSIAIFFSSAVIFGILSAIFNTNAQTPFEYVMIPLLMYSVPLLWIKMKFKKLGVKFTNIIGPLKVDYKRKNIIGIVIMMILFSLGAYYITYYPLSFILPNYIESILNEPDSFVSDSSQIRLLYSIFDFLVAVIIAPVIEEIIFRGILLHRLSVKWNTRRAIIFSSLIFGILHFDILGAFTFGVVLSILYVKTKSLKVPILCHMLNNAFASFLDILSSLGEKSAQEFYSLTQFRSEIWFGVFCLCVSAPFLAYYLWKNWPKKTWELPYYSQNTASTDQIDMCV